MTSKKRYPKIHLTPLRGKLKLEDVRRAVEQVIAEREVREKAARSGPEHARRDTQERSHE